MGFVAFSNKAMEFESFRKAYNVTCDDVRNCLSGENRNKKVVSLIDDLNLLKEMNAAKNEAPEFLRDQFLVKGNRYFVFTSHILTASLSLETYMETHSGCTVLLKKLPVVPSLVVAIKTLREVITALKALYYGLSPDRQSQNVAKRGHRSHD
jgi:hypothetical protein